MRLQVAGQVEAFYNDHPFPDFDLDKYNTQADLRNQASWYFKLLDTYIPDDASIIEIGCGTGQLVNFMALKPNRKVMGLDLSGASLKKARQLRDKIGIKNLTLHKRDIFEVSTENTGLFQYTFCNGVLHHTHDPYLAFLSILKVVRPMGFLTVGFYNTLGRIPLQIVKAQINKSKKYTLNQKKKFLGKLFTVSEFDDKQTDSWFADQFLHPQETTISVNQALSWFRKNKIAYVNSFPPIEIGRDLKHAHLLHLQKNPFKLLQQKSWKYSPLALYLKQAAWMVQAHNEGGYYSIIGQKRDDKPL